MTIELGQRHAVPLARGPVVALIRVVVACRTSDKQTSPNAVVDGAAVTDSPQAASAPAVPTAEPARDVERDAQTTFLYVKIFSAPRSGRSGRR